MKSKMYQSMYEQESIHWYFISKHEIVLSLLEVYLKKQTNIIDFGCGTGIMLKNLSQYGQATGMDVSQEALDYCRQNNCDATLIQGNLETVSMQPQFDVALALDVLEHTGNDLLATKNIYDALNENGICIVTVPAFDFLWSKHDENCMHKRRYTKAELARLASQAGFTIDYISYYNFWLFPMMVLVRMICKLFKINQDSALENSVYSSFVNKLLYKIFSSEKNIIKQNYPMPFGVGIIAVIRKSCIQKEEA